MRPVEVLVVVGVGVGVWGMTDPGVALLAAALAAGLSWLTRWAPRWVGHPRDRVAIAAFVGGVVLLWWAGPWDGATPPLPSQDQGTDVTVRGHPGTRHGSWLSEDGAARLEIEDARWTVYRPIDSPTPSSRTLPRTFDPVTVLPGASDHVLCIDGHELVLLDWRSGSMQRLAALSRVMQAECLADGRIFVLAAGDDRPPVPAALGPEDPELGWQHGYRLQIYDPRTDRFDQNRWLSPWMPKRTSGSGHVVALVTGELEWFGFEWATMRVSASGRFAAIWSPGRFIVVDTTTDRVLVADPALAATAIATVAYGPDENTAAVVSHDGWGLSLIDLTTHTSAGPYSLAHPIHVLTYTRAGRTLVGGGDRWLFAIDPSALASSTQGITASTLAGDWIGGGHQLACAPNGVTYLRTPWSPAVRRLEIDPTRGAITLHPIDPPTTVSDRPRTPSR